MEGAADYVRHLNPAGITPAAGPDDLPRYFREIHANALASPLSRAAGDQQRRGLADGAPEPPVETPRSDHRNGRPAISGPPSRSLVRK